MPRFNDTLRRRNTKRKLALLWGERLYLNLAKAKQWLKSTLSLEQIEQFVLVRLPNGNLQGDDFETIVALADGRLPSRFSTALKKADAVSYGLMKKLASNPEVHVKSRI